MGSIIISMPKTEDAIRLKRMIRGSGGADDVLICERGAEILEQAENQRVSLVICTARFRDMGYEELVSYLPQNIKVLLLTKDAALIPFADNVVKLLMPFRTENLIGSVRTLMPDAHYSGRKKRRRSPEEEKIINEAKQILMDRNAMTEPEAFRYIQKTSMDTSRTLIESAQMILLLHKQ